MICNERIVSIVVVEVILLHDEHITSLLSSKKKDRRKARLLVCSVSKYSAKFLKEFCCTLLLAPLNLAANLW